MDQKEKMRFFYEIFDASLPRLGPGDDASTVKALEMVFSALRRERVPPGLKNMRVLDVGCGNGAQTIQLATHVSGTILAVDNHRPFIDELQRRAEASGVSDKIRTLLKNMGDLMPEDGIFDLIWSEGALYSMGFKEGLLMCRSLLAPGGCLAATELCWIRSDPPAECRQYLNSAYPPMADIDSNLANMVNAGYEMLGHFTLPESAWRECYYDPIEERLRWYREEYASDPERMEVADSIQLEIDMYRKYSGFYGYVFYIMRSGRS